jgi:hypothetical protein
VIVQDGVVSDRKNNKMVIKMNPAIDPSTIPATAAGAGPAISYAVGMAAVSPICRHDI